MQIVVFLVVYWSCHSELITLCVLLVVLVVVLVNVGYVLVE